MIKSAAKRWLRMLRRAKTPTFRRGVPRRMLVEQLETRETPATYLWSGAGPDNLWMTGANWQGGARPTGAGDDLVFPPDAAQLANVNNFDPVTATFNSITLSGSGYTLTGQPVVLGSISANTGYIIANQFTINNVINFDLRLGGAAGNRQFFTVGTGGAVLTINGAISNTTGVEISKDGQGTLVLTHDNSGFDGPISVTEGILRIQNALALGDTSEPTTVLYDSFTGKFGQLQVHSVAGNIAEPLILNGVGPVADGALLNTAGNNTWTGNVELDSNTMIGAVASSSLAIRGVISDLGSGHDLTKEGAGTLILDPRSTSGNTYRGQTLVNDGILNIRHSLALGNEATPTAVNQTVVNSFPNRSGTLQLQFSNNPFDPNATGSGFTVPAERLTLNGPGFDGIHVLPKQDVNVGIPPYAPGGTVMGALNNAAGNNTWAQDIQLWSGNSAMLFDTTTWDYPTVGIGAEAGAQLVINGRIRDQNITNTTYSLIKTHAGRVVLAPQNPVGTASPSDYRGRTEVLEGFLNIRDSAALGQGGSATNNTDVYPGGTLELEADAIPDSSPAPPSPDGKVHLNTDIVLDTAGPNGERIRIMGNGVNGNGAIRNILGTNEIQGTLPIIASPAAGQFAQGTVFSPPALPALQVIRNPLIPTWFAVAFQSAATTIGVQPDQAPYDQFHWSQLTVSGVVSGAADLNKVGTGELVLTDVANTYSGQTFIRQGWVTIRNDRSLGAGVNFPDTISPETYVAEGAALVLKETRALPHNPITVPERVFASGDGITHRDGSIANRFNELNHNGAILNLSGNNLLTGIVTLVSTNNFSKIGIGADIDSTDPSVNASELQLTNQMREGNVNPANAAPQPPSLIPAGVNKLGLTRVRLQGQGVFTGDNRVSEGQLRVQTDTALGMIGGATTVAAGAALELQGYNDPVPVGSPPGGNGGVLGGIQLFENFVFAGLGASRVEKVFVTGGAGTFFRLTFNGQTTADIPYGSTALSVKTALEALSTIGVGEVVVTLSNNVYMITFDGALANTTLQLTAAGVAPATATATTISTYVDTLTNFADDNMIRGPITLQSDIAIETKANSRLSLWKSIDGAGGITKEGDGKLVLGGVSTYDGVTNITRGVVNLQSSSALGSPAGGTVVSNNAQIELQGDITIGGESLTILGDGPDTVPNLPTRFYPEGPGPINNGQTIGNGNVTGRVTGIAVDPNDVNVIYASAAGGGLWRTKNSGQTWEPLIDDAKIASLGLQQIIFTGAMAVAPTDSGTIYVGLGEANNSGDSYYGHGVLKSSDYGRTWTLMQFPGNDRRTISKIVVDPVLPDVIYVAVCSQGVNGLPSGNNNGVWRFNPNTNPNWINLPLVTSPFRLTAGPNNGTAGPGPDDDVNVLFSGSDQYTDVVVMRDYNPFAPNNRFVLFNVGDSDGRVRANSFLQNPPPTGINATYLSINVGVNQTGGWAWNRLGFTVTDGTTFAHNGVIKTAGAFTPDPNNPPASTTWTASYTFYSAVTWPTNNPNSPVPGPQFREIWKETVTWDTGNLRWSPGNWGTTSAQPANYMAFQGAYDTVIAVRPDNVNYVFVAGVGQPFTPGPFVSTNGGGAWTDIGLANPSPHVDYHASGWEGAVITNSSVVPFANPPHLVVGSDGGVWRLNNGTPGSIAWQDLNNSFLQITQFNGLDVHPSNPFYAVGGSQDNGTEIYNDSPYWTHVEDGDGGVVRINNNNANVIFHVLNGTLRRSTNGGASWTTINGVGINGLYFPFVLDRVNPSRLLAPNGNDLRESSNSDGAATFNTIASGAATPTGYGGFGIVQIAVADRQGNWANDPQFPLVVDNGAQSYDPDTIYVLALTVVNNNIVSTVAVSKNHGIAWATRTNGLNVAGAAITDLAVDPRNRDIAYAVRNVFGGAHVYRTTDAGQNWTDISSNLPDLPTWCVTVNPRTGDVYIGNDNGVYMLPGGVGGSWSRLGVGLPTVQVKVLVFNPVLNMLSAGTYGRGLYQIWLDESKINSGALRAITGSSVWTGNITLTGNIDIRTETGAQLNIVGAIADSGAGNFTINKLGTGRLVFSGPNTYGGLTNIREGVLVARNPSALGDSTSPSGDSTVFAGAALELQGDLLHEKVFLNGNGIQINGHNTGALRNVSNDNTFTGTLVLNTNSTIGVDSGSQLTIGTKSGDPTGAQFGAGTITEDLTLPPIGQPRTLTKELTGTLILNTSNAYTGVTDIVQGALDIENATALGPVGSLGTQVRNGAQLQINKDVNGNDIIVTTEHLDLSGTGIFGTGAVLNIGGDNTWQGTVTLLSLPGIPAPPPATPPNHVAFGAKSNSSLAFDNVITDGAGNFGVDKVGLGRIFFKAADTYDGATIVYQGALNIQNAAALGASGSTATGTTVLSGGVLELQAPGNINPFNNEFLVLNGTGIGNTGALRNVEGNNTWQGRITLQSNSAIGADAGTDLVVSSLIRDVNATGPASGNLHKVGLGRVIFTNATNTYRGTTFVDEGILDIRAPQALGVAHEVQTVTVTGVAGSFKITFNGSTTNDIPIGSSDTVVEGELNSLPSILDVGGAVSVVKTGNVYTITFDGGTLAFVDQPQVTAQGFAGATTTVATTTNGAAGTIVADGATLQLENVPAPITDERLTINGLGFGGIGALQNLAGQNIWARQITLGSDSSFGSVPGNATYPASGFPPVFEVLVIDAAVVDGGNGFSVTKVGQGVVFYTGFDDNTYEGLTIVSEGVLVLDKAPGIVPFSGDLVIGDSASDPDFSAVVAIFANESIPDAANNGFSSTVTINPDGFLELYTVASSDTIDLITVDGGNIEIGDGFLSAGSLINNDGDVNVGAAGGLFADTLELHDGRVTTTDFNTGSGTGNGTVTTNFLSITGGTIDLIVGSTLFLQGSVFATSSDTPQTPLIRGDGVVDLDGFFTSFQVDDNPAAPNTLDLQIDAPIVDSLFDPAFSGLEKFGNGVMAINSDANTFDGGTGSGTGSFVDEGVLQVNGTIGDVFLGGGTLGGDDGSPAGPPQAATVGVIQNAFPLSGGTVAPGDSPGTLNAASVTLDRSDTFFVELDDHNQPGTGYDQLIVSGTIDLGLANLDGDLTPLVDIGQSFTIIQAGNVVGQFAQGLFAFIDGKKFDIQYNQTSVVLTRIKNTATVSVVSSVNPSVWGQAVTFTATVTPEPSTGPIPDGTPVEFHLNSGPGISSPIVVTIGLTNSQATFDPLPVLGLPGLEVTTLANEYKLIVVFPETADFDMAQSPELSQRVDKANTAITVSSSLNPSTFGDSVTITADVNPLPPGAALVGTNNLAVGGGTVTFFVDGTPQPAVPVDATGAASINLTNLSVGGHLIGASYSGTSHFNGANTTGDLAQQVNKAPTTTTLGIAPNPADPGQNVVFSVHVNSTFGIPSGTVVITDGSEVQTVTVTGNAGTFTLTFNGSTTGSLAFDAAPGTVQTALNSLASIGGVGGSVTVTKSGNVYTVTFGGSLTGVDLPQMTAAGSAGATVIVQTFTNGGNAFGSTTLNANGDATFSINTLPPGRHTINVNYLGSTNYETSFVSGSLIVRDSVSVNVVAAPSPATVGNTVSFTVTVAGVPPLNPSPIPYPSPGGTVSFYDGAVAPANLIGSATLNVSGVGVFNFSNLAFGGHTINVTYPGDGFFLSGAGSTSITVKGNTTTSVSTAPNPSPFGQVVTITANVTANAPAGGVPGGTVQFFDGTTLLATRTLSGGSASFDVSNLSIGVHTLRVDYQGASLYNASSGSVAQTVQGNTTTTITSSLNPSTFGQQVTFTITVSAAAPATGTPTGNVTILDNGNVLAASVGLNGSGVGTFSTSSLTAGTHVIRANYNGATLFATSSGTLSPDQLVNIANTSTTLTSSTANPTLYGQPIDFRATIVTLAPGLGTAVGSVDFFDGAILIGNDIPLNGSGVAIFSYADLNVGTHANITAHYNGTNDFAASTSSAISRTVNKTSTTTQLTSLTGTTSVFGQTSFTATVSPVAPGGGVPSGTVTFTITSLATGTPQTFTGNLAGGTVTITPFISPGNYSVQARYNGTANYFFSDSNTISQHTVTKADTTTGVTTNNANAVFGAATITAAVAPVAPGAGVPSGQVVFHVAGGPSGGNYSATLNGSGQATLPVNLSVGTYTITADYLGDANFNLSSGALGGNQVITPVGTTVTVASDHNPSVFGQAVTFSATITRQVAGNGAADGTANLLIDGVTVQSSVTVNNGLVTFLPISDLSVAGSPHGVQVIYNGSLNFNGSSNTLAGGQTVNKGGVAVNLAANPTATFGATVSFDATVSAASPAIGSPGGTADLFIDGSPVTGNQDKPVIGGAVSFSVTDAVVLSQGNHTVQIHYDGEGNFLAGDSNITTQSVKGNVSVAVISDDNTTAYGDLVTFTVTVSADGGAIGTPSGAVDFIIDGVTVGNGTLAGGQATFQTATIGASASPHTVVVHYNGDTFFFTGDSPPINQTVAKADTFTGVTSNLPNAVFGQLVTFTATVSRQTPGFGIPDGTVDFFVDGNLLQQDVTLNASGQASIQASNINAGPHTITVHYDGSSNFNTSNGTLAGGVTVSQASTTTTVASSLNPSVFQQNVTFTAHVTANSPSVAIPNGTVDFVIDGGALVVNNVALDASGNATYSTSTLALGDHTVQVHYDGNSNFIASDGTLAPVQTVKQNPVIFALIPGSVKSGAPFTVVVHYQNAVGTSPDPTFNGPVTLALASGPGAILGTLTANAVGGVATFTGLTILKAGAYTLAASVNGLPAVVSPVLNVTASSLAVAITPRRPFSRTPFLISVAALDATGAVATNYNGPFTVTVVRKPPRARITGPAFSLFSNGFGQITRKVNVAGKFTFRVTGPDGLTATFRIAIRARRLG